MERNKFSTMAIIAVILGAAGLGVGAYSVISVQTGAIEGEDGDDGDTGAIGLVGPEGDEGDDGQDAPGGIIVGILDPDQDEVVSGNVTIRALVAGSEDYTVSVLRNSTEIGTSIPMEWNTTLVADGWYNITVRVVDVASGNETQDEVIVYVLNTEYSNPVVGILDPDNGETISGVVKIRALVYGAESYSISILRNGTEIATTLPYDWDTTSVSDDWYNITVIVTDVATNNVSQDEVIVYVLNLDDPTNIYYCSSGSEVQNAIAAIGTSTGTIMITQSITLDATININGGGSYIIQGVGSITIDCNGDRTAFYITSATVCTIRELKIDASDITSPSRNLININEISDNPIYIDNVQFIGDADRNGYGIYVQSENVWVKDSYFYQIYTGISIYLGNYAHISDNTISDVLNRGISVWADYIVLEGNSINLLNGRTGIFIDGGDYNTITGNYITGSAQNDDSDGAGIFIDFNADYNTVVGNGCFNFQNSGSGVGYGIRIFIGTENTIIGNTALNNEQNFLDSGTNTFGATLNNFA